MVLFLGDPGSLFLFAQQLCSNVLHEMKLIAIFLSILTAPVFAEIYVRPTTADLSAESDIIAVCKYVGEHITRSASKKNASVEVSAELKVVTFLKGHSKSAIHLNIERFPSAVEREQLGLTERDMVRLELLRQVDGSLFSLVSLDTETDYLLFLKTLPDGSLIPTSGQNAVGYSILSVEDVTPSTVAPKAEQG